MKHNMSKLVIYLQFFCVVCMASEPNIVSDILEPTMKSFSDVFKERMKIVDEIKLELQEKQKHNYGLAITMSSLFTNESYKFRQEIGSAGKVIVDENAKKPGHDIINITGLQTKINDTIMGLTNVGGTKLGARNNCLSRGLHLQDVYIKSAGSAIQEGLNELEKLYAKIVQECFLNKDFSTVVDLESWTNADNCIRNVINSAIQIEIYTNTKVDLLWKHFKSWYDEIVPKRIQYCEREYRFK